jgi:hypothetical protein
MPSKLITVLLLSLLLACSRGTVDRAEWQRMSHEDRVLYVRSMVGAEKVKDAKGATGRLYDRPPEEYVQQIDAAYARGDQREANEIFGELGTWRR